jgi:hypothetical protein
LRPARAAGIFVTTEPEDAMSARRVLLANAIFTAISAGFIVIARDWLYPLFALDSALVLLIIAGGLAMYAASLGLTARRGPDRQALVTAAVLDAGWVLGSVIVLAAAWPLLDPWDAC